MLGILIEYESKIILLQGIYGPNLDNPNFYDTEVFSKIEEWNPHHTIFAGDWNIILDRNLDTMNYQALGNPRARNVLIDKMNEMNLIDIFREIHPNMRKFTWKQWGSQKYGRLDYFLISNSLIPFVKSASISSSCYSDHSPIILEIDFSKFQRGKGFWKLNNSLLSDPIYVELIKNTIKKTACQYSVINDDPNFVQNLSPLDYENFLSSHTPESIQALNLSVNNELFLDTLLMEIRRATIKYSCQKKKDRYATQQLLMHDIEVLESIVQGQPNADTDAINELNEKKDALEKILDYEAEGAFIRSRASYRTDGERPTKLFCNLESYNGVQKYVSQLITKQDNNEVTLSKQKDIEKEIHDFYKDLFKCETLFLTNTFIYTFRLITGEFKLFNIVYFMIH